MAQGEGAVAVTSGAPAGAALAEALALADWRRRIAGLYAEVRRLAVADPAAAHAHWRVTRERLYREHPQSPVPAAARARFRARHFAYDPALRFEVTVDPAGGGEAAAPRRLGRVRVPFAAGARMLWLFWIDGYADGLFLPFADATSGSESYGGGRYLIDGPKGADLGGEGRRLTLDFNFAYQPSCAFDPRWACPLAPAENRLDVPVRGGERLR